MTMLKPIRVLIVDDHIVVRSGLGAVLAVSDDMSLVGEAGDGEEAIQLCERLQPDVILMDMLMPKMDGIELARRASELDPDLKIMFITGFAAVILNSDTAAPKDARVLSKPFHLKDLVREVDRLLAA